MIKCDDATLTEMILQKTIDIAHQISVGISGDLSDEADRLFDELYDLAEKAFVPED